MDAAQGNPHHQVEASDNTDPEAQERREGVTQDAGSDDEEDPAIDTDEAAELFN